MVLTRLEQHIKGLVLETLEMLQCFHSVEGGAVTFSDPSYRKKLHNLKNFGINGPEDVEDIGGNAKLDEFRAAMGICNLRRMDECINARRKIYERYVERLDLIRE